jgi:hypothetical protein
MREVGQSGESFSALNEPYELQRHILISTSKPFPSEVVKLWFFSTNQKIVVSLIPDSKKT